MRSRNTAPHPAPGDAARTPRRATRSRSSSGRRRARAAELMTHPALVGGPEALYRAEKARRANDADAALMAEAKRLYDEAVAETGKRRAGMRSAVVPPGARRAASPPKEELDELDAPDEA